MCATATCFAQSFVGYQILIFFFLCSWYSQLRSFVSQKIVEKRTFPHFVAFYRHENVLEILVCGNSKIICLHAKLWRLMRIWLSVCRKITRVDSSSLSSSWEIFEFFKIQTINFTICVNQWKLPKMFKRWWWTRHPLRCHVSNLINTCHRIFKSIEWRRSEKRVKDSV